MLVKLQICFKNHLKKNTDHGSSGIWCWLMSSLFRNSSLFQVGPVVSSNHLQSLKKMPLFFGEDVKKRPWTWDFFGLVRHWENSPCFRCFLRHVRPDLYSFRTVFLDGKKEMHMNFIGFDVWSLRIFCARCSRWRKKAKWKDFIFVAVWILPYLYSQSLLVYYLTHVVFSIYDPAAYINRQHAASFVLIHLDSLPSASSMSCILTSLDSCSLDDKRSKILPNFYLT